MGTTSAFGRVAWFDEQKGFGSIRDQEGRDYFVRYTGFQNCEASQIREGTEVEFETLQSEAGREAWNVRLTSIDIR